MHRSFAAGAAIMVLGSCATAPSAATAPMRSTVPLTVDVRDYGQVPPIQLSRAIAEVKAIFQDAGVASVWEVARWSKSSSPRPDVGAATSAITAVIYPSVLDDEIVADPNILGVAPGAGGGGHLVYVFSSRVGIVAKRHQADSGTLLGLVLAHEMGHVLLKGRAHSKTGVMRPACAAQQLQDVLGGRRAFNPIESNLIRSSLLAVVAPMPTQRDFTTR